MERLQTEMYIACFYLFLSPAFWLDYNVYLATPIYHMYDIDLLRKRNFETVKWKWCLIKETHMFTFLLF
jgi:hypothetical protein